MEPIYVKEKEEIVDSSIIPTTSRGTRESHPWLLMLDIGERHEEQVVFYSISEDRYYKKRIPYMHNKKIFAYNKEWLVIVDPHNLECYLLNAVTMEKIELPKFPKANKCNIYFICCYLTSSPRDPNCRVVFVEAMYPEHLSLCQPGDDNFTDKEIIVMSKEDENSLYTTTFFNGSIYGLEKPTLSLMKANVDDPTLEFQTVFSGESIKKTLLSDNYFWYLIESCGELLVVTKYLLHREVRDFQVFRADFSSLEWVYLTNIGDRAIFLDQHSSQGYSCSTSGSGIQGNCIYDTDEVNRLLYTFNLENGTYTSTVPCPIVDRKKLTQHWIMIPPTNRSS